jgi:hypothetical protein
VSLQSGNTYQAKLNATKDYMAVLKEQGLNPNDYLSQE